MSTSLTLPNASTLEDDLRALFEDFPIVSSDDMAALKDAARKLERDPQFHANFLKGKFVALIMEAMEDLGVNQTVVASKWGRSRQYLSKLLNEDKRVNFTFETATELAMAVNRKFDFVLVDMDELKYTWRYEKLPELDVTPSTFREENGQASPFTSLIFEERPTRNFTSNSYGHIGTSTEFNDTSCELPA